MFRSFYAHPKAQRPTQGCPCVSWYDLNSCDINMISIWDRYDIDMISIWYRYNTDMISIWYRYHIDMISISRTYRYHIDIILISYRYHNDLLWIISYQDTQGQPWVGLCAFGKERSGQNINFRGKHVLKQVPWSEWSLDKTPGRFWCPGFEFKGFRGTGSRKWWFKVEMLSLYEKNLKGFAHSADP